jgi:hypothetical protein
MIWILLLLMVVATSPAGAQCQPSGRSAFAAGLEALQRGDWRLAGKVFYQLVQDQPACPEARNNLAVAYAEEGRLEEAAAQLRQALQIESEYARARANLARVEALLAERGGQSPGRPASDEEGARLVQVETPPEGRQVDVHAPGAPRSDAARVEVAGPELKFAPTNPPGDEASGKPSDRGSGEGRVADAKRPKAPAAPASGADGRPAAAKPAGPGGATVEPRATTACVIEPALNRVCVSQRGAGGTASDECYPIAVAQVRTWPRWLVASEVTPERIRLLDETGQTRLEIAAEDAPVGGDALRLKQADFDALAPKVIPWRTGWLILE